MPTTPPARPIIIRERKTEIPAENWMRSDSYLKSQDWVREQDNWYREQRQRDRQHLHTCVMEEVDFVQTLGEKLVPKKNDGGAGDAGGVKKPSEMETKLLDELGAVKGMLAETKQANEKKKNFKEAWNQGMKEGEQRVRNQIGWGWGGNAAFGGGSNGNGIGWAGGPGPGPIPNGPMGAVNIVPQQAQYSPYYQTNNSGYVPVGYQTQRRRSSASSIAKRVAKKVIDQVDAFGNRITKDIKDDLARAVALRDHEWRDRDLLATGLNIFQAGLSSQPRNVPRYWPGWPGATI